MNGNGRERELNAIDGGKGSRFSFEDWIKGWRRYFESGGSSPPPETGGLFWIFLILLVAVVGAMTSFYTVDVSEEGVVTRFGRYSKTTQPGLHFKLPFMIDRVIKVPSKVLLQSEFGFRSTGESMDRTSYSKRAYAEESLMLTGDLNVADVEWILQYRISDPWKYLYKARNVQKTIRDVSMSIMRRVVGDRFVGEVLTIGRVEIADEAKQLTQVVLDKYDMGITVVSVVLQDVNPPESVKAAFNEINAAKQEQERDINIAEREYNKIIPEARGKAEQLIADAKAYGVAKVNQAKGDASQFKQVLREYLRAPDVTRRRLYLETMEEVFQNLETLTIVDSKVKGLLPLFPGGTMLPSPKANNKVGE